MNIVLVQHKKGSRVYAFSVSDELAPYVKKGQGVLCETMRGIQYGTTFSGLISGDGALDVAVDYGAYFPLKPIIGFEHPALAQAPSLRQVVRTEFLDSISNTFGAKA